ncbi:MAG: CHAT domain-containing protein, partial [Flavobacteriaceae bacterium]
GNSVQTLFKIVPESEIEQIRCLAFAYTGRESKESMDRGSLEKLRNHRWDLPGSRKEVHSIAEFVHGNFYTGNQAIENNFKAEASNYNILHLALHGEINEEQPQHSRLIFGDTNLPGPDDNLLYNHEIFNMNLPAQLAVLSACDTGAGRIVSGEGIMSIGSAFQYAGTKCLLLTRWSTSDEITPGLIRIFYKELMNGATKSSALQQAKLSYLESANIHNSHPYYWGGFYVLGKNHPLISKSQVVWLYPLVSLGLAISGFVLLGRVRKK